MLRQKSSIDHGEVSRYLLHDDRIRVGRDREHMHFACRNDHNHANIEHFPSCQRQHRHAGEIDTGQRGPVRRQEYLPGLFHNTPIRHRLDTMSFQNPFNRRAGNRDVQSCQDADDFSVSPGILGRQRDDQLLSDGADRLSAAPSPKRRLELGNSRLYELLIPSPQGRRRHQPMHMLSRHAPTQWLAQFRKLPFVSIRQVP